MIDILYEWLGYLGRWGHIVAVIVWIGTSFYFNWLDLSERPPKAKTLKPNVVGEVHEMHGGSFYYHERFWPTEDNPRTLAHSGPAQLTFLTGLFLVFYIYWLGADVYLLNPGKDGLSSWAAIGVSALVMVVPWLIYHALCKAVLNDKIVFCVMAVLVTVVSYLTLQVFSPRAAFVHVGAMLGTIMAANVQYVIIPNHIKMRGQVKKSEPVNQEIHKLAKRRSQHNNYMTLPVVFSMISIHFPLATLNEWAWITLLLVMASLFTLRHYRNIYLATDVNKPGLLALAFALLAGGIAASSIPAKMETQDLVALSATEQQIFDIVQQRCSGCHAAQPTEEGYEAPPAGVRFETMAQMEAYKDQMYTQAIASDLMPPGNWTEITDTERQALGEWLVSVGAVVQSE